MAAPTLKEERILKEGTTLSRWPNYRNNKKERNAILILILMIDLTEKVYY